MSDESDSTIRIGSVIIDEDRYLEAFLWLVTLPEKPRGDTEATED